MRQPPEGSAKTVFAVLLLSTAALAAVLLATVMLAAVRAQTPPPAAALPPVPQWLDALRADAQAAGVSRATFDTALNGFKPDFSLPDLEIPGAAAKPPKGQAEFTQAPSAYLSDAALARLAAQGKALAAQYKAALDKIEQDSGVPGPAVLAIWGRETAFSTYKLPHNAIPVLATQAYTGRRKEQFRNELIIALKLLERGAVKLSQMQSSWAGAMGPTQFMPSDYEKYAVDMDGDGKADPWTSIPDALASAARQLAANGWQRGQGWGFEVRMPKTFDCTQATLEITRPVADWLAMGMTPARGARVRAKDMASVLMPAGPFGPSFLTLGNFQAIRAYNLSDLYALYVANLADRIAGSGIYATPWSRLELLPETAVSEMQQRLKELGHYTDKVDGKAGGRTRASVGVYQKSNGLAVDCWPNAAVLAHMRSKPAAGQ
jgi:lytic murein transglycosylase